MPKEKIIKICDQIIEYGILAIVFFVPIIFDFTLTNYNAFDLLKSVIFRVILSLVLLVYTTKVFIGGQAGFRGSNKIFLLTFILLTSFFISSLLSINPNSSFWGSYERTQGFYNLANYLLFFVLLILNFNSLKQIRRVITAVVLSGALVCLYGLIQLFGLDTLPWQESGLLAGRIFSSLGQPNFFGQYLALIIPLTIYCLFFIAQKLSTIFLVGLVLLAELVCLANTYSRAAWLGVLAAAGFFILIYLLIKRRKTAAIGFAVFILIGAVLFFSLNFLKVNNPSGIGQLSFANRLKSIVDIRGGSNIMRLYYWQGALTELKGEEAKRLIFGYGPDALADIFVKYYRPDWAVYEVINTFPDRAHNWLFDNLLSLGWFGLAASFLFYAYFIFKTFVFLFGRAAKTREETWLLVALSASLVAYGVNNLFSFSLFTGFLYLYLILAMLWFLVGGGAPREIQVKLTAASKIIIWLALAAVMVIYVYLENVNFVRADYYYMLAKKAEQRGDCRGILDNMEQAVTYQPASVYYKEQYIFHGLNCFSSVSDRAGRLALRDNIAGQIELIKPQDYQYITRLTLARAYSLFGFYLEPADYAVAEKIYLSLIGDYPELLTAYQDFGRMKMWQKDYNGALKLFKQAEKYLPPLDHPLLNQYHREKIVAETVSLYEKMGLAYNQLKDYDAALAYYKRALALDPFRAVSYKNIADIYYVQGRLDQAIALNKRGLILNPGDYNWPLGLSLLYRDKKDLIQAKAYLDQALKLAPENQALKNYYKELNK